MSLSNKIYSLSYRAVALFIALLLVGSPCMVPELKAAPQTRAHSKNSSKNSGKSSSKSSGKSTSKSTSSGKKAGGKSSSKKSDTSTKGLSAEELKRRQESARQEVTRTKEELRQTESSIKRSLSELSRLESGIAASKKETEALGSEVRKLTTRISVLQTNINAHTAELEKLRAEYLKAVKKMRVTKKSNSTVAYLFGASNVAQAERRMRYLKEFSEWKDARTREIGEKVAVLKRENEALSRARSDKDVMLGRELKAQQKLTSQKKAQDEVVATLRSNQSALESHLAKKQQEVNQLGNQVAALIAEEQRRAEAARRAEEQRRAEEARIAEERRQAEEARRIEAERREAAARLAAQQEAARVAEEEARRAEEAARKAEEEARKAQARKDKEAAIAAEKKAEQERRKAKEKAEKARKEKEREEKERLAKEKAEKERAAREKAEKEQSRKGGKDKGKGKSGNTGKENGSSDYANARRRQPRGSGGVSSGAASSSAATSSADFASMRGSLPRPVSGSFRITSPFGRHTLPDLPDVTYDNPGIDAEVQAGATAQAVYGGTVSGVYMIPGFSTVVIVNHGDYYTVYGNIASSSVKVGDRVRQGQSVGQLTVDPDNPGHSEIHFEVWKGKEKMNPQNWIR